MFLPHKMIKVFSFFINAFFILFFLNIKAQEIRVIDNKGTRETVRNNNVTTGVLPVGYTPLENDVWFDTTVTPSEIKIYNDAGVWVTIDGHRGTTGSIFFADAIDGSPTEDNDQLFWDDTNDRLGIGTDTPLSPLHIEGSEPDILINDTDGGGFTTINFQRNGTNNTLLGLNNDDNFYISIFNGGFFDNTFTINNGTRNIGIGVAEANSTLQINGSLSKSILRTTAALVLTENNYSIIITDPSHNVVLPAADATNVGREYIIKNTTSGNVATSSYQDNTDTTVTLIPANNVLKIQSNGTDWEQINNITSNLDADQVNTVASTTDLNGDGAINASDIIDVDGDGILEATSQSVFEAITPITSKAARIFYPPSIAIDASVTGTFTLNLYDDYIDQFGTPLVSSSGAPAALPTYEVDELYYYVTNYDTTILNVTGIDGATGEMTYEVLTSPSDDNTIINVVFMVK